MMDILISIVVNFFILLITVSALKKSYSDQLSDLKQSITNLEQRFDILEADVKVYLIASKPITTSGITVQEFTIPKDKYDFR